MTLTLLPHTEGRPKKAFILQIMLVMVNSGGMGCNQNWNFRAPGISQKIDERLFYVFEKNCQIIDKFSIIVPRTRALNTCYAPSDCR